MYTLLRAYLAVGVCLGVSAQSGAPIAPGGIVPTATGEFTSLGTVPPPSPTQPIIHYVEVAVSIAGSDDGTDSTDQTDSGSSNVGGGSTINGDNIPEGTKDTLPVRRDGETVPDTNGTADAGVTPSYVQTFTFQGTYGLADGTKGLPLDCVSEISYDTVFANQTAAAATSGWGAVDTFVVQPFTCRGQNETMAWLHQKGPLSRNDTGVQRLAVYFGTEDQLVPTGNWTTANIFYDGPYNCGAGAAFKCDLISGLKVQSLATKEPVLLDVHSG